MRKFLKISLVIICIAMLCIIAYTVKYYFNEKQSVNTVSTNEQSNTSSSNEKNSVNNNINNNQIETPTENKIEDDTEKQEDKVEEETSVSNEDKAIELAKKQYGTTTGVYFRIEQIQSTNVYIISVRDNETTKDLAWYTVDVKNETVR